MLGIVTGLASEARIAGRLGTARAGGGTPPGAARAAEALVAQGATALLSFGFAGGLDPRLPPGTLLIPRHVTDDHATWTTDPAMIAQFGGATIDTILAGHAIAATVADKRALLQKTGAAAIDLESGAVAEVAASHHLPFAVLRAVCDPADRDLPPAALAALDAQGGIAFFRIAASVLRNPGQFPGLLRLASDAAASRKTLARAVARFAR